MSAWETLGIAATPEEGAIRRAYAARVRQWRPDTHPQEFARLREAYEQALRWARLAVQEAGQEEARQEEVRDLPVPPALAGADAMMGELAQCFSAQGEIEAIALLRQHYALVSAHTIDARLDWEQVLLASLLGAETPPLSLLFEADRLLGWRERPRDVAQMFGHEEAGRLRVLLELARETTFLRFFSPNRWQRRLFGAARLPRVGMTVQLQAAHHSVQWWRELVRQAGRPALSGLLDARVLRRLEGRLLMSTDLALALLCAWVAWPGVQALAASQQPWVAFALAAGLFALALPLPLLARRAWQSPAGLQVRRWRDALARLPFAARALGLGVLLALSIVALAAEGPLPLRLAAGAILGATGAVLLAMGFVGLWCVLRLGEQLLSLPWLWLQRTWGLHALRGVVDGGRLPGWGEQLRALPSALVAAWRLHRAGRRAKAEQRQQERLAQRAVRQRKFNYWWIFWGLVVLQAVVRVAK